MKGVNKLHMNEATLKEAVQEYLNKCTVGGADIVTSVCEHSSSTRLFVITLEEPKAEKPGQIPVGQTTA